MEDYIAQALALLAISRAKGGGSGGTGSYSDLSDKPQIGGITLDGDKSPSDLGLATSAQANDALKAITGNATFYVASDGDDTNSGTSSTDAFATIDKAVTEGSKYRSCIINIGAGTFTMSSGSIDVRGAYSLSIRGAGAAETTINGRFSADRGAYVNMMNLTINSTADSTSNGGVFGFESAQIYLNSVNISAAAGPCVNLSTLSVAYLNSCTFSGTPSYTVRSASGARAGVRGCTGISGKNARAEVSGELHIDQCTDMTYVNATQGIVFVDGTQVLPAAQ